MKPVCRAVRLLAPSVDEGFLPARFDAHVAACLPCQAEMARYGRLRRHLAGMADEVVAAPRPLSAAVAAAIGGGVTAVPEAQANSLGRVVAAAGAVTAAAAGTVAVILWRHSRPAIR